MLKIGITGGIGSGKTTVSKIFELLHVPVYYADAASKELYHTDEQLMNDVKQHFGPDVYVNDKLDKGKLSAMVFSDPAKLELLNSLVHPLTIKHATRWMADQNGPYLIKEAALLFETGSTTGLDYIIGVYAPRALRIKRVCEREGITRDEVIKRMERQIDESIKMKLCDFVITNDEQQAVIPQVLQLHEKFLSLVKEDALTSNPSKQ